MKQHDQPLAAALSGHQRGAVGERGPGALGQRGIGLGQHLAADADVARHHHAEERALAREGVELLRLLPRQAAAENTPAASEFYRHEIVVGGREMRTGKAHQHATVVEPAHEAVARLGDVAHVGEDHHRQPLLDELVHGLCRRAAIGQPYIGEGPERAPAISNRAMSLRISTGIVSSASLSRSPSLKVNEVSPSGRPLRSSARTVPVSPAPLLARKTFTVSAPAALSAAASARAPATPPSITVMGRCSMSRPSAATNSLPPPRSTPSESQTSSTSGVAARKRPSAGSASARSTACGFGLICLIRTRAAAGVSKEMSRAGSESGIR